MPKFRRLLPLALLALPLLVGCETTEQKLTKQGLQEYKAGDFPAAENTFDQLLVSSQSNAQANYYAGMAAFRQNKLEMAAYHLKLAWNFDPSMPETKDALVEVLIRQGKPDMALDFLERDAALTAKTVNHSDQNNGKRPYAFATEDKMYAHKADDRCRVARVYERLGDLDNAALNFDMAAQMAPNKPGILLSVGQFYARIGKTAKAAKAFDQAYHIDPKYPGLAEAISQANMTVK